LRLGELLVHTGVISSEQLDAAVRQQVVYGGRLGTNLIELGYADYDDIAHALARLCGVPAALTRHLNGRDPVTRRLVPRAVAARFAAVPIAFAESGPAGRSLVVCMRTPGDQTAVEQLVQKANLPVIPCVGPELAVFALMEADYGIQRNQRYAQAQVGASPLPGSRSDTYPTIDEAEALSANSIDIDFDTEVAIDDEVDMPEMQLVQLDHHEVERDFTQYSPDNQSMSSLLDEAQTRSTMRLETERPVMEPPEPEPELDAAAAAARIRSAEHRDAVSSALVAYLRRDFGGALLLVAKQGVAYGHTGFGGRFDEQTVQSILLPLTVPSMFELAVSSLETFRGPPPADGQAIQSQFFKLFSMLEGPSEALVVPVMLRGRVPMLVYAHGKRGGGLDDRAVQEVEFLCRETADAFVRLIKSKK